MWVDKSLKKKKHSLAGPTGIHGAHVLRHAMTEVEFRLEPETVTMKTSSLVMDLTVGSSNALFLYLVMRIMKMVGIISNVKMFW